MNSKTWIFICVVVGLFWFTWSAWKKTPQSDSSSSVTATDSSIKILDPKSLAQSAGEQEHYMKLVAWDQSERKINLKRTPVSIANGEATLQVEITTKGTCFPGDANAIEMDLKAAPNHKLMATIEDLSDSGKSLHWDLPDGFLTQGMASKNFKLPVGSHPTQYGFYLCTAEKSDKTCQGKTVRDINEIFTEHVRKDANAGKELRTIFFQYFMLDERGVAAFASYKNEDQKFEELKQYAKERGVEGRNLANEIDGAKKKMNTLLSYPFVFDGKSLKIELPQYNLAACGEQGK
ncbi:hypothetical protein EBR78_04540 [bacterium]|nr:hypothetical protein [bacterium]NBX83827.1 hypothetical protein [bacterium]